MRKKLTEKQLAVLDYIKNFTATRKYQPSQAEIGEAFGISKGAVESILRLCAQKGYIKQAGRGSGRAIQFLSEKEAR